MNFAFFNIYRHIYRKWVSLVDSKCRNTVILTGLTYTSSRKVFHDGCAKRGIFSQQIFNKNSLSLAHCALNRSFTVYKIYFSKRSLKHTHSFLTLFMHTINHMKQYLIQSSFHLTRDFFCTFYCNLTNFHSLLVQTQFNNHLSISVVNS